MQDGNLSIADGMIMRSLVNFPGGLELHIGVRTSCQRFCECIM
jgi:hypothetical protein